MNAGGEPCPAHLSEVRCAAGICLPGCGHGCCARWHRHLGVRGTSHRASRYGPESRAGSGRWSSTSRRRGSRPWPPSSAGPCPRRRPASRAWIPAPSRSQGGGSRLAGSGACPGARARASTPPDPGPVPAPGPLPAALPERGPRIAALRRVRSRRSREHCPSGLGFYGVNPQWPGNVLHV